MMMELIFVFACILIYVLSFIYRRICTIAAMAVVYIAYLSDVNFLFVLGMVSLLAIVRVNKSGIKDEI